LIVLAAICVVVAALYFARDVLVPLALSVMLSFLLGPLVTRLERRGIPRGGAVTIVAVVIFTLLGALAWLVFVQVEQLAEQLPRYQDNIVRKIHAVRGPADTKLEKAAEAIARAAEAATSAPATQAAVNAAPGASELNPLYTKVVGGADSRFTLLGDYVGMILGPIGTFGLVVVFVIFMLIQREDLRDRVIRLVGEGQLHITTQAIDDAANRISRYLVAQAIVNGTYGIAISIGLCIIGFTLGGGWFPSFALWGLLCALLRFIPYIGPWIAAAFPVALSFAVYPGYSVFVAVLALFVIIELASNNLMEPWLYGSSTGISTVAIIVAAVFWTWLWGAVGLLLATPLTVCIVVIGKYVPQLAFLDVLLGDQPVLEPHQRLYQRLLAGDSEEASDIAEEFLQKDSLEVVYNGMVLPALSLAEHDRHSGRIDERRGMSMRQTIRALVEELADQEKIKIAVHAASETERAAKEDIPADAAGAPAPKRHKLPKDCIVNVVALPAHDEADEIVGMMLAELLRLRGYCATPVSHNALTSEMIEEVDRQHADLVCVSALPPEAVMHARYLCKRLHERFSEAPLVIGLWTMKGDLSRARQKIGCGENTEVTTDLEQTLEQITQMSERLILEKSNSEATPAVDSESPVLRTGAN
jgi:predicted PurR-regulated permease PerM